MSSLEAKLLDYVARLEKCEEKSAVTGIEVPSNVTDMAERELQKQQALKNNICISGIPKRDDENISAIVAAVMQAIAVPFTSNDVSASYRTKPRAKSTGLIVVRFETFDMKLAVLTAKKKTKQLSRRFEFG